MTNDAGGRYLVPWRSIGLWRKRRLLQAFLGRPLHLARPGESARPEDVWLGWGRRDSGLRAQRLAERDGCGFLLLEDGFVRSLGLGVEGAAPLSIVADRTGIYYDATAPSDLESHLQHGDFSPEELRTARELIAFLRREGLSKYNTGLPVPEGTFPAGEKRVLVVDQTAGDASIRCGMADEADFARMLWDAADENPDATIYVKTHPDVLAGRRRGCLANLQQQPDIRLITENYHPHDLLRHFDKVYVVTSQMGFDALILGKEVHCFGMPFYAGWGLTHDRLDTPRRAARRTLEELVAAALLRYARYRDPVTNRPCAPFTALRRLSEQKRHYRFWAVSVPGPAWSGRVHAFGFRLWKQPHVRRFFGEGTEVIFSRSLWTARLKGLRPGDRIAVWGLRDPAGLEEEAERLETRIVRVEDGFIRSAGLGSDFHPACSLVFDDLGIYFDPATESRLERILREHEFDEALLAQARALQREIVRNGITKYNLAPPGRPAWADRRGRGQRIILVPGQVENDASIRRGGGRIRTNADLLKAVREKNPDAFIVYKPHPDLMRGNRLKGRAVQTLHMADHVETQTDIIGCIEHCDEVHTITSLSGFDALLRHRRVVTYGMPFYAGWGLTEDCLPIPRRGRRLRLEELVAGVLILYPRYVLPHADGFAAPQEVIRHVLAERKGLRAAAASGRQAAVQTQMARMMRLSRQTLIGAWDWVTHQRLFSRH